MRTTPLVLRVIELEISRFPYKKLPYMPGSQTTQGQMGARDNAPIYLAFRNTYSVGTLENFTYAAQWLAYTLPCRRFTATLTGERRTARGRCGSLPPSSWRTLTAYFLPVSRRTSD